MENFFFYSEETESFSLLPSEFDHHHNILPNAPNKMRITVFTSKTKCENVMKFFIFCRYLTSNHMHYRPWQSGL